MECLVYQCGPNTVISWPFSNRSQFFFFELMVIKAWSWDFVQLWVVLLASPQYRSTHFFSWPSISWDHVEMFASSLPELRNFSVAPAEVVDSNTFCNCRQYLCLFRTSVECTPSTRGQRMMLVLPNRLVSSELSSLDRCFVSFQPVLCRARTEKNGPLSRFTNNHSQFGTFSQPCSSRNLSNCLYQKATVQICASRTTGSSMLDHDLGHLCSGRRIQKSGQSDFIIFNNVSASSILNWV